VPRGARPEQAQSALPGSSAELCPAARARAHSRARQPGRNLTRAGAGGRDAPWVAGAVGSLHSGNCVLNHLPGLAESALGRTRRAPLRQAPCGRGAVGRLAGCERGVAPACGRRPREPESGGCESAKARHSRRARVRTTEEGGRRQSGSGARRWEVGASGGRWSSTATRGARSAARCAAPVSSAAVLTLSSAVKQDRTPSSVPHGITEARNLLSPENVITSGRARAGGPAAQLSGSLEPRRRPTGPERGRPSVTDDGGGRGRLRIAPPKRSGERGCLG